MAKFTLKYMFLNRIQYELNEFKESWNNHPIKTKHNYSPLQLVLIRNAAIDYNVPTMVKIFFFDYAFIF